MKMGLLVGVFRESGEEVGGVPISEVPSPDFDKVTRYAGLNIPLGTNAGPCTKM